MRHNRLRPVAHAVVLRPESRRSRRPSISMTLMSNTACIDHGCDESLVQLDLIGIGDDLNSHLDIMVASRHLPPQRFNGFNGLSGAIPS